LFLIELFVSDQKQIGYAPESLYPLFLGSAPYGILEFSNPGSVVRRRKAPYWNRLRRFCAGC
jgi:hypothetical protein